MPEALNTAPPATPFFGKSLNNHPQWHNQPLRLTKEKKKDPLMVFYDFFECYHLQEARETTWNWLKEVISSQHSIAQDPHERSNHIFFYEKIEELIEAAFVISNKAKKAARRRRQKGKWLHKNSLHNK